jgi:hypothetical protein
MDDSFLRTSGRTPPWLDGSAGLIVRWWAGEKSDLGGPGKRKEGRAGRFDMLGLFLTIYHLLRSSLVVKARSERNKILLCQHTSVLPCVNKFPASGNFILP